MYICYVYFNKDQSIDQHLTEQSIYGRCRLFIRLFVCCNTDFGFFLFKRPVICRLLHIRPSHGFQRPFAYQRSFICGIVTAIVNITVAVKHVGLRF